jgi:hypothetical protein
MTGRRAGYCTGYERPGFANAFGGFGRGRGRGFGRGFAGGFRWRQMPALTQPAPLSSAEEKQMLEQELTYLKEEMKELQNRLKELQKSKS